MNIELEHWLKANNIPYQVSFARNLIKIDEKEYLYLEDFKDQIFDEEFSLNISEAEYKLAEKVDYLIFKFGNKFYYTDDIEPKKLIPLKYKGVYSPKTISTKSFLGIHSGYDLCNGTGLFSSWLKKAEWLGITTVALCEDNTLSGLIPFQNECASYGIKGIVGQSILIQNNQGERYTIKLYCMNSQGWKDLLKINSLLIKNHHKYVLEEELVKIKSKDLVYVLDNDFTFSSWENFQDVEFVFFNFNVSEWDSQSKDEKILLNLLHYLKNYKDIISPIIISDAYYIDQEEESVRKLLNIIGKHNFKNQSSDQYFKTADEIYESTLSLFKHPSQGREFVVEAIENCDLIADLCEHNVVTGNFFLPEYEQTEEELKLGYDKEELLRYYISLGYQQKKISEKENSQEYLERIERELAVIKKGGFIDYFLILIDIIRWCKTQNIWTGVGRGSAAGCLISYLTGIVLVDPIRYNLLFERFLNEGRLGKALPDIDNDTQGSRRDEVKRYMEERYGRDYVASLGTYGTFKIKNAIKDLSRVRGLDSSKVNFVTAGLDPESGFIDVFKTSQVKPIVKQFIQDFPDVIEQVSTILKQPKNASIHAAGVVIVPKEYGTIYEQLPVRLSGEQDLLVTEWEGEFVDQAGFLKCDILGIAQLDKFSDINKYIQKNYDKDIRFEHIPLEDEKVLKYFQNGWNEDVFQFGAAGLKAYCLELKPDNIEDLIATVALYRPGPIESGAHKKYAKIKNGLELPSYDEGIQHITEVTYGEIIYQEQIMRVFTDVGKFTLVEADDLRKVISKTGMEMEKKRKILGSYIEKFIEGGTSQGLSQNACQTLWDKIEKFATYSFNRSHAACYALTGYYSQWYKVNYPLEFWTVSLLYSLDTDIARRVSEATKTTDIKISGVDINLSTDVFEMSVEKNAIYWALTSVKQVGPAVATAIITERTANGQFYSLEEFLERVKGKGANKRAVTNLILCGAFDSLFDIGDVTRHRWRILKSYYINIGQDIPEDLTYLMTAKDHEWVLRQKELTGYGFIQYTNLVKSYWVDKKINYYENQEVLDLDLEETDNKPSVMVCGLVVNTIERSSRKGPFLQVEIIDNTDTLFITIWNESYQEYKEQLSKCKGKIILLSGDIVSDSYKNQNVIHSNNRITKIVTI